MNDYYKLILSRIDTYISSVNTKGGLIVAFCTFLFGSILSRYSDLKPLIESCKTPELVNWLIISLLVISLCSVFFVGLAVFPFLKSGNSSSNKYHSLMFFNSIAEFKTSDAYCEAAKLQNNEDSEKDLQSQIYLLSVGLKRKFQFIGWAMRLFFLDLLTVLSLTIIILL